VSSIAKGARRAAPYFRDPAIVEAVLANDPQARRALAATAVRMVRQFPEVEQELIAEVRRRASDVFLGHPRGARLSGPAILRKKELGIVKISCQVPGWSPKWSKATYTSDGLSFNADAMELHVGPEVHVPLVPSLWQQSLEWLVLHLGWESLRRHLEKYAIDWKEQSPQEVLSSSYNVVMLSQVRPYYLLLPGELININSAELVELSLERQDGFNGEPLVGCELSGTSKDARIGLTAHLSASAIHPGRAMRSIIFEVKNLGRRPVKIWLGICFGQLLFYELQQDPVLDYFGHFEHQVSPCGGNNGNHRTLVSR
jgi:hypothetical protein